MYGYDYFPICFIFLQTVQSHFGNVENAFKVLAVQCLLSVLAIEFRPWWNKRNDCKRVEVRKNE